MTWTVYPNYPYSPSLNLAIQRVGISIRRKAGEWQVTDLAGAQTVAASHNPSVAELDRIDTDVKKEAAKRIIAAVSNIDDVRSTEAKITGIRARATALKNTARGLSQSQREALKAKDESHWQ